MKRFGLFILLITFPFCFVSVSQALSPASTEKTSTIPSTVKIGFLYPITGSLSSIGKGLLDGATAAAYRANQTYNFKVVLLQADSATDPATTKTAAQSLVSSGVGVIVGAAFSGDTLSASKVTIPNRVTLISYASTKPSITNLNDSDYVFRDVASDVDQGLALANLSYNSGAHSIYILNQDNIYGNGVASKFKAAYETLGGVVKGQTPYDPATSSYATEVTNVKNSGADAVVIIAQPDDANKIFSEAAAQNVNMNWFATDGIATSSVINGTAKAYLNGKLFGTTPSTGVNASNTLYPQFLNDLIQTGGTYDIYSDYAYDAVLLAAKAINDAGSATDGTAIRNSLYKVANDFEGSTNPNKAFNCDGEPINQIYDYWNATNYAVTTQKSDAVAFTGLGTAATASCGNHPYPYSLTSSSSTSTSKSTISVSTPGFEVISFILIVPIVSYINRRRKKNS